MSAESRKGYRGERAVELYLGDYIAGIYRPRAGNHEDVGDIAGLPIVVSVKNHARMELSSWVDDLTTMVLVSGKGAGVVWHHRRGRGSPGEWYVTTSGRLFIPMFLAYAREMGG